MDLRLPNQRSPARATVESALRIALLPSRSPAFPRQFRAILIANGMRSPASATDSQHTTYDFLIANEFQFTASVFPDRLAASFGKSAVTIFARQRASAVSNRNTELLETPATYTKRTTEQNSNRNRSRFFETAQDANAHATLNASSEPAWQCARNSVLFHRVTICGEDFA